VVVGFTAGEIPKLPLNLVLLRSCDIRGVFWGAWCKREPQALRTLLAEVAQWCADGKLSGHVHAVYPLKEIAAAMKAIADRKAMGKIVLQV
jgi:NADPH:quinone reductase